MKAKFGVKLNKKDNMVAISQNGNIISTWTYNECKGDNWWFQLYMQKIIMRLRF